MKFLGILTFLTLALTLNLSAANFRFKHIEATDGLSDNKINVIHKDRQGFVWIGSASGLNRFDGYSNRIYRHVPGDSTSLGCTYITEITEDRDGRLWMLAGGGYVTYDPVTERFNNRPDTLLRRRGINGMPSKIVADSLGLWLQMGGDGIYRLTGDKAVAVTDVDPRAGDITAITPLGRDNLTAVIDNRGHINILNPDGSLNYRNSDLTAELQRPSSLWAMADGKGLLWIYGEPGVWVLDTHSGEWYHSPAGDAVDPRSVRAIAEDENGRIWIGTDNEGVAVIDKNGSVVRLTNNPADIFSLGNNSVTTLMSDDNGTMWVGTQKKGVSMYNDCEFKFDLVPMPDVNCIIPAGEAGRYWIGTDHSGLMKWDAASGELTSVSDPRDGGHSHAITSLVRSADGSLWVGSFNNGLKRYRNGAFTSYTLDKGLPSDNIWAIAENNDGTLWLGTLGGGLILFNPADGGSTIYTTKNSPLPADYIITLCTGSDGNLYAGTSNGLAAIEPLTRKISVVEGPDSSLRDLSVTQVFTDSRGLLWVGTQDGLKTLDLKSGRIYDVPLLPDRSRNYVLGMTEDAAGRVWVSVDGALLNITVDTNLNQAGGYSFSPRAYTGKDGLQNSIFNQRSMARLDNGDIVVGGVYGLNRISPSGIRYNLHRPKVIFTGLTLQGGESVNPGEARDGNVILDKSLNLASKARFNHRQNSFTIYFATDNHILPEHTTYYYKLEGLQDDWLECEPGMHQATYTNLSPGKYRFVVKAANNDGVEGDGERTLEIIITPPLWATLWAKIIYALLGLGAIILLAALMRRHERRRYVERQREESARKQEELNQMKFKFYTNVSHELRTPLTLILSPLESMMKEPGDERTAKRLATMHASASRLLYLVNQLLDFRKSEVAGLSFSGSTGDIVEFTRHTVATFADMAEKKEITLAFTSNVESLDMTFDHDKMGKIIINLLSNAMKFTPGGGKVDVALQFTGKTLRLNVADSGCGVPDSDKPHVFERFYQSSSNHSDESGSGIGLSLVKEYARLHEGEASVSDTPGGGATFTVEIPVNKESAPPLPAPAGEAAAATANADKPRPTALIVDDNRELLEFMGDELADDFNIITAPDGLEALETARAQKPDIVVTDLMMPRMDGMELCRRLKSDPDTSGIPVMVVTAKQEIPSMVEGLAAGADDYVTKPFNNDVLRLRMRRLTERRRREQEGGHPRLVPEPEKIAITSLDEKLLEKAVKYVQDNISRSDLSVEELSKALGMSRVHLYKKILHITGKTPVEFIRILRLKRSAQYLRESQLNVSEIAYQLGFNNPKYFSKYFQEEYGMSPSEYQKRKGI